MASGSTTLALLMMLLTSKLADTPLSITFVHGDLHISRPRTKLLLEAVEQL